MNRSWTGDEQAMEKMRLVSHNKPLKGSKQPDKSKKELMNNL